jgi:diaminohydroxyphosphoribosylaminopyrimidine deaminase/5-amino-6-(5-phosphoribosylamino)uracil reductase
VLAALAAREVQSVLVEGGADLHGAFIAAGLVDRVAFFLAPSLLGGGVPIAAGPGRALAAALPLGPSRVRRVGRDLLLEADVLSA